MTEERRDTRLSVILLDSIGYSFYQDLDGRKFMPADRYRVRLVTDIRKVPEAIGHELESVIGVPKHNEREIADAVRFQAALGGIPATRLIAVTERLLLPAARLREELKIAGLSVAETLPFRDKVVMKHRLRDHGIRVPDFASFSQDRADELLRAHHRLIVKPRLGTGATDIYVLRDRDEIAAFARTHAERLPDFQLEEFIEGQLCHVDSIVQDAKVVAAVGSRYLDDTRSYLEGKPCRDSAIADGPELDRLLDFNQRVIACYPGFTGVTHHEMFVAGRDICFCEIGARAGGGGVIAGFLSRTGVNLDEAVVQAQLVGSVPVPKRTADHLTGWTVLYPIPGILREPIEVPQEPWVIEAQILANAGDQLSEPVNCNSAVAIISVRGDTEAEVASRLAEVIRRGTPRVWPIRR
jgi:biotin carboxylase